MTVEQTTLYLDVIEGSDKGRIIALEKRRTPVGRRFMPDETKSKWILFSEPTLCRTHAVIDWDSNNSRHVLLNKAPEGTTDINGEPCGESVISAGDLIRFGGLLLKVRDTVPSGRSCEYIPIEVEDRNNDAETSVESPVPEFIAQEIAERTRLSEAFIAAPLQHEALQDLPVVKEHHRHHEKSTAPVKKGLLRSRRALNSTFFSPGLVLEYGDKEEEKGNESANYYFLYLKSSREYMRIPIYSRELREGIRMWLACSEEGNEDPRLVSSEPESFICALKFSRDKFLLSPMKAKDLKINDKALPSGGPVTLKTGDIISKDLTRLIFIEHQVLEELSQWEFLVIQGEERDLGRRFDIVREVISIGRARSSDIKLHDGAMVLLQDTIHYGHGRFFLIHRSRMSTTFLNGSSIQVGEKKFLSQGDIIRMSPHTSLLFTRKNTRGELYDYLL
ncbi:MAG: FHA domain-containing protein [Vulcanimicrobiota bacterium]